MKKSFAVLWAVVVLVGMLATGCNKSTNDPGESAPPGVSNEQSARAYWVAQDDFVNNDSQSINDGDMQPTDYGNFGKIEAAITPLRWGRFVNSVTTTVIRDSVGPGDSIAVATVHKVITGVLKIRGLNGSGDTIIVQKPFTDNADRRIIFRRFARETKRYWLNWLPVATSLIDGGTTNNDINITKLEVMTPRDTIVVTDPLHFYLRFPWRKFFPQGQKDVPEFAGGGNVTVKVTLVSSSPDTDLAALRFGMDPLHRRRMRMQLVSQRQVGTTYERVFQSPTFAMHVFPGFFHIAVDAMTRATLFDDNPSSYSVSWWGVPYRVL